MSYPIQPGKIQAPALRDETLARTRLLDWLDVKVHSRVLFVIADAGYGKTTLLADFSRRTRLRTIWYRLDEDDRDWVGFLSHLVAAGREFNPDFAPRTASILRSLEPGGPTREDAIETFLEELPTVAGDGAALIFDDFHLADEVPDIRLIAREIVVRGPERLSVVFASRRPPAVPVAKLRSLGELAELGIGDLRFSDAEMEQLFRETYGRPLESDVLTELSQRTEGWAASLTLVQAALRERTPAETRSFVRGLSGARDELHDYLAEEVVGDLPEVQQRFLMRTSILQRVTPELAQIATGLTAIEVQSMITEAERLGMLGRRANRRSREQRFHPLVREFLEDRLRRDLGDSGVEELHVAVARWAETSDWQTAAHHYTASRRWPELHNVLETHLATIVASGAFSVAAEFFENGNSPPISAAREVISSRLASVEGDLDRVIAHARSAAAIDPTNEAVRFNLIAASFLAGDYSSVLSLAETFTTSASSDLMRLVGRASSALVNVSVDLRVADAGGIFDELADRSQEAGLSHFEGVSLLNSAACSRAIGDFEGAFARASRACDLLAESSSGTEHLSAQLVRASILAYQGDLGAARRAFLEAGEVARHLSLAEYLIEFGDCEALVGSSERASSLLDQVKSRPGHALDTAWHHVRAVLAMREGNLEAARASFDAIEPMKPSPVPGQVSRRLAMRALISALERSDLGVSEAQTALTFAETQGARLWRSVASLALGAASDQLEVAISTVPSSLGVALSFAAELLVSRLDRLEGAGRDAVLRQAQTHPERWLPAIRRAVAEGDRPSQTAAAHLLAQVGAAQDIRLLGSIGRQVGSVGRDRRLARDLARRLAARAAVDDLGRVTISLAGATIGSGDIRRKVLALLCYLVTRPQYAATREEVLEALWPALDPASAINSLNQTVYFLRRVFEPDYTEDTSAGYVHQDSDLVWLDRDLVSARSTRVAELITHYDRAPSAELALQLSDQYTGRFALDFAYEEWSVDFRDWLHVSYLRIIENRIRALVDEGNFEPGILLARRALEAEPRNEELELSLLRLLKGLGAHSAAAEQYSHYATMLKRDLDLDAPSLDSL